MIIILTEFIMKKHWNIGSVFINIITTSKKIGSKPKSEVWNLNLENRMKVEIWQQNMIFFYVIFKLKKGIIENNHENANWKQNLKVEFSNRNLRSIIISTK
jgi:hypothetical protein